MPVANLHVPAGTPHAELIRTASEIYASAMESPVDRVRVFVHSYEPDSMAVGGVSVADGAPVTPYFEAIAFEGRRPEQYTDLLARMSQALADVCGVDLAVVRGRVLKVSPEDWAIAGVPASVVRKAEIEARAAARAKGE